MKSDIWSFINNLQVEIPLQFIPIEPCQALQLWEWGFWGNYFLVVCFPWLLLLDQCHQKCNTMCFWHQSSVK